MTGTAGTANSVGNWPALERGGLHAAPLLLGSTLTVARGGQVVSVRLTEVEAYEGSRDPGSHAYRGQTPRTASMFGPVGHVYVYFTYGMHWCLNIVCGPPGTASAVLLRAGEVIANRPAAVVRRGLDTDPGPRLASGPARLARALGLGAGDDGSVLFPGPGPDAGAGHADPVPDGLWLSGIRARRRSGTLTGPRTGVSGPGGGEDFPWRFRLPDEPTVSPYRAASRTRGAGRTSRGTDRRGGSDTVTS